MNLLDRLELFHVSAMERHRPATRPEPLSRYEGFRTSNPDEAREKVASRFCDHSLEPLGSTARFDARQASVTGGAVSLHFLRYGSRVKIDPGKLGDFFLVQMPLRGTAHVTNGRQEVESDSRNGSILNPDRDTRMVWDATCAQFMVRIERDALHQFAESYLDRNLPKAIRFSTHLDLQRPELEKWRRAVLAIAASCDRNGPSSLSCSIERELLQHLVEHQRSTLTPFTEACVRPLAPYHAKRALSYIRNNVRGDLSLKRIAAVAGVSPRALQLEFRRALGRTPVEIVVEERLRAARASLLVGDCNNATDAAAMFGFSNVSRFSRAYKNLFGHRPRADVRAL